MWGQTGSSTDRINLVLDEYKKFGLIRVNMNWLPTRQVFYDNIVYQLAPFKGILSPFPANGSTSNDIDFILQRLYVSDGDSCAYPDAKTDDLIRAQRKELDPIKRGAILKDFQMHVANYFPVVPAHNLTAGWTFSWPWLHNVNKIDHTQWLDEAMPKRNG